MLIVEIKENDVTFLDLNFKKKMFIIQVLKLRIYIHASMQMHKINKITSLDSICLFFIHEYTCYVAALRTL